MRFWRRRTVHDYAGTDICQTHQSADCPRITFPEADPKPCGALNAGLVAECIRNEGHDGDHQGISRVGRGLHSWEQDL